MTESADSASPSITLAASAISRVQAATPIHTRREGRSCSTGPPGVVTAANKWQIGEPAVVTEC
jgi:hypothetical protein